MKSTLAFGALLASTLLTSPAIAVDSVEGKSWDAKERFMIRARVIDVIPDESSSTSVPGATVNADAQIAPELDVTYFFTDHVAVELIAATTKHEIKVEGSADLDLGTVYALPPTLNLQYHLNPFGDYRPYVGAGLGYLIWYNEDNFGTGVNDVEYDNGIIYSLQAGMDIAIDEHWAFNADVKKFFHNVDATVNNAITADVDLDPWVVGVGVGYRF